MPFFLIFFLVVVCTLAPAATVLVVVGCMLA
jgi:hypothetical protein